MAKKLFGFGDVKNHPRRSGFDLSNKNAFSAKAGELLPVYWKMTMPGDKFNIGVQWFTRTSPVNTAAYTRVREYFDWFYVPLHVLWRHAPEIVTQMQKNVQHSQSFSADNNLSKDLPYLSLGVQSNVLGNLKGKNNQFGFDRSDLTQKLFQYLNYGNNVYNDILYGTSIDKPTKTYTQRYLVNVNLNVFPLIAYQKFYQDYYRYSQWENSAAYTWNIDYYTGEGPLVNTDNVPSTYWQGNTMFDLRYANWNKDIFMGVLPNTQYGTVATVQSTLQGSNSTDYIGVGFNGTPSYIAARTVNALASTSGATTPLKMAAVSNASVPADSPLIASLSGASAQFNILALRQSEALQRWKEVAQCSSQNYKAQIKAHFGVDVGDNMSGISEFIDGFNGNLDISEVLNTNLATSEQQAEIAGKGIGTGQGHTSFYAKDWGILMCIYHCTPLLEYVVSGPDPQLLATQNTDLPIPEMDAIGMEPLRALVLSNSYLLTTRVDSGTIFGYSPRYIAYKTAYDQVHGMFQTTAPDWVAPITQGYITQFMSNQTGNFIPTYNMFKVNPSVLDSIFAINANSKWDTDQFKVNAFFDVKVARNLDYDGMPY